MALRRQHHHGDSNTRYQIRERLISVGDDYWIENGVGQRVYKVDGKALRLRDTWLLEDAAGREVARIKEHKLSVRDAITIDLGGGCATVKKALVGVRDRFHVEVESGDDLKIRGNIVDHEYEIERHGDTIATVSKKWFRVRDSYGVEVGAVEDAPLVLAVVVALDAMAHD